MRKCRVVLGLMAILITNLFCLSVSYAVEIDKIIVFGDSLSDNGNIYSLTRKTHGTIPGVPIVPKLPPYYEGRFTNGQVWVEDLAQALNVPLANYAYGGSWAEPYHNSGLIFPFSLGSQVDMYFMGNLTDRHTDKHLYIVWSGANDYIQGRDDHEAATTSTVEYIRSNLDWLIYYGAKQVLVINLPDISIAPEIISKGPDAVQAAADIVKLHNQKLAVMLDDLRKKYPKATIVLGDVTDYMDDVILNPKKYGLSDISHACYGGGYWYQGLAGLQNNMELAAAKEAKMDIMASPDLRIAYLAGKMAEQSPADLTCSDPDKHMFWDQLHPTRQMHKLIADVVQARLAEEGITG